MDGGGDGGYRFGKLADGGYAEFGKDAMTVHHWATDEGQARPGGFAFVNFGFRQFRFNGA